MHWRSRGIVESETTLRQWLGSLGGFGIERSLVIGSLVIGSFGMLRIRIIRIGTTKYHTLGRWGRRASTGEPGEALLTERGALTWAALAKSSHSKPPGFEVQNET